MSDDGRAAIVVIAMLGNPFSPAYARARAGGPTSPLRFSAMNVAVYGPRDRLGRSASAFSLEEGPLPEEALEADGLAIRRSTMRWEGARLVVELDERTTHLGTPRRHPVRGRVIVHPEAMPDLTLAIDERGAHRWWPVAPLARIEVELDEPRLRFSGHGYHDANAGDTPLESAFETWSWSRARVGGRACLTYDAERTDGTAHTHAFTVDASGRVEPVEGLARRALEPTIWRVQRHARVDLGAGARTVRALEDGPFYTRSLVKTRLLGRPVVAMHEMLAAHRLRRRWVQFCTAYRMRSEP